MTLLLRMAVAFAVALGFNAWGWIAPIVILLVAFASYLNGRLDEFNNGVPR